MRRENSGSSLRCSPVHYGRVGPSCVIVPTNEKPQLRSDRSSREIKTASDSISSPLTYFPISVSHRILPSCHHSPAFLPSQCSQYFTSMNKYQPLPRSPFDTPLIWFISGFYEFKGDFFSQEIDNAICFKGRWNSRYFQKKIDCPRFAL